MNCKALRGCSERPPLLPLLWGILLPILLNSKGFLPFWNTQVSLIPLCLAPLYTLLNPFLSSLFLFSGETQSGMIHQREIPKPHIASRSLLGGERRFCVKATLTSAAPHQKDVFPRTKERDSFSIRAQIRTDTGKTFRQPHFVYLKARRKGKCHKCSCRAACAPVGHLQHGSLYKQNPPRGPGVLHESSAQSFTDMNNSWPGKCVHKQFLGRAGSRSRDGDAAVNLSGLSLDPWSSSPLNVGACPHPGLCPLPVPTAGTSVRRSRADPHGTPKLLHRTCFI